MNESELEPLLNERSPDLSIGECDLEPVGVLSPDGEGISGGVPECRSMNEGMDRMGVGGIPE